jgi:competence protein ComGC
MQQGVNRGGPPKLGTAVLVVSLGLTALVTGLGYVGLRQRLVASPTSSSNATTQPTSFTSRSGPAPSDATKPDLALDGPKWRELEKTLHTIRSQTELYRLQHADAPPDFEQYPDWAQFVRATRRDGTPDAAGGIGPYLLAIPINPVNGLAGVRVVDRIPVQGTTPAGERVGFICERSTGLVFALDEANAVFIDRPGENLLRMRKPQQPAAPPAATAADDPDRVASALSILMSMRSQIELYKLQHRDEPPDLIGRGWEQLLRRTAVDGSVSNDGQFGPYVQKTPVNPFNGLSGVGAVSGVRRGELPTASTGADPAGFLFDPSDGRLWVADAGGLRAFDDSKARAVVHEAIRRRSAMPRVPEAKLPPDAKRSLLDSRLGVMRSQIELYKLQHSDRPPDLLAHPGWAQLTKRTRADGTPDRQGEFGPYLQSAVSNPLNGSSQVYVVKSLPAGGTNVRADNGGKLPGFYYENSTGLLAGTDERGALVIDWDLEQTLRRRSLRR